MPATAFKRAMILTSRACSTILVLLNCFIPKLPSRCPSLSKRNLPASAKGDRRTMCPEGKQRPESPESSIGKQSANLNVDQNTTQATPVAATRPLNVVAIGGGTGLSTLLKGLKQYVRPAAEASSTVSNAAGGEINIADLTAVVTVTDDGGS